MKKLNIVLDLDETLIKSVIAETEDERDIYTKLPYYLFDMEYHKNYYCIFERPGLFKFLTDCYELFNIYVVTMASKRYCDNIIEFINNKLDKNIFTKVYCRDDIEKTGYKSLTNLNISIFNTIIIDDRIDVWIDDFENMIIPEQYNGPHELNYENDNYFKRMYKILYIIDKIFDLDIETTLNILYNNPKILTETPDFT